VTKTYLVVLEIMDDGERIRHLTKQEIVDAVLKSANPIGVKIELISIKELPE